MAGGEPYGFDLGAASPHGFKTEHAGEVARLIPDGDSWTVTAGGMPVLELERLDEITVEQLSLLRDFIALQIVWDHERAEASLTTIARLAVAGVPLVSIGPIPIWAESLGPQVCEAIDSNDSDAFSDSLLRELRSVRQRRAALARHAAAGGWKPPSVSVVICTCRPEYLEWAIESVNRQRYNNLELVLVLHGFQASTSASAVNASKVPVRVIEVDSGVVFGEALNAGFEAASGDYVTKLDDDDWYGPNHLLDIMNASRYANATIVGSFSELVHLEQLDTTIYRPASSGEKWVKGVAGGTITIARSDFKELNGFPSLPTAVDAGLLERAREAGGRVYRTHGLEYVLARREQGHTWDVEAGYFLGASERQFYKKRVYEHVLDDSLEQCLTRRGD